MARIIAGIAASHTPTIGFAKDTKTADDPAWADKAKQVAGKTYELTAFLADVRQDQLLELWQQLRKQSLASNNLDLLIEPILRLNHVPKRRRSGPPLPTPR